MTRNTKGCEAIAKLLPMDFTTVLDIGSGDGFHAQKMRKAGKRVTTLDINGKADINCSFDQMPLTRFYDAVWACHVLEHQPNVGNFLKKCFAVLDNNGIMAVTVPPRKDAIVGGHLTLWNAGLLLYNMVIAGFDCSQAMVKTYGYNISVIVRKKKAALPQLAYDNGDIERLSHFFPFVAKQGFDGVINQLNW